jgi:hypothetical protein
MSDKFFALISERGLQGVVFVENCANFGDLNSASPDSPSSRIFSKSSSFKAIKTN